MVSHPQVWPSVLSLLQLATPEDHNAADEPDRHGRLQTHIRGPRSGCKTRQRWWPSSPRREPFVKTRQSKLVSQNSCLCEQHAQRTLLVSAFRRVRHAASARGSRVPAKLSDIMSICALWGTCQGRRLPIARAWDLCVSNASAGKCASTVLLDASRPSSATPSSGH